MAWYPPFTDNDRSYEETRPCIWNAFFVALQYLSHLLQGYLFAKITPHVWKLWACTEGITPRKTYVDHIYMWCLGRYNNNPSRFLSTTGIIDQSHKPKNTPVPCPKIHHSEQKCAHFCHWRVYCWIWDNCIVGRRSRSQESTGYS